LWWKFEGLKEVNRYVLVSSSDDHYIFLSFLCSLMNSWCICYIVNWATIRMFKMSFNIYEYISDLYINVYINNNVKGILIFIQWKTFRYRLDTISQIRFHYTFCWQSTTVCILYEIIFRLVWFALYQNWLMDKCALTFPNDIFILFFNHTYAFLLY